MNILMISTDRTLFEADSAVRTRLLEQAELVKTMRVIVLASKGGGTRKEKINERLTVYSTDSANRFAYMFDAYALGQKIIRGEKCRLVTAQDPFWTGVVAYLIARKTHAAFHVQLHTDIFSAGSISGLLVGRQSVDPTGFAEILRIMDKRKTN